MWFFQLRRGSLIIMAVIFTFITISLAIYPEEGLSAAKEGLRIFWEIVFPSLLPFFVLSEILLGLGVVNSFGVLLEPLMRPVFNVPGAGAFALSMGLAAGYPMDAVITGKFRRSGLCTRIEGERLLAFTNTADPLFMFGAVAVGMFGRPELGMTIAIAHYLAAFSVGFIFRFYGRDKSVRARVNRSNFIRKGIVKRALNELYRAKQADGRPFGQLMGDAVKDSINTLLMIGGFIMVFSVFVAVMDKMGLVKILIPGVSGLLNLFGLSPDLSKAFIKGVLEIDLGTMATAQLNAPLNDRIILAGAIIAWSGLSVHGQVISVIHDTDIRLLPYIVARVLHAVLAGVFTCLLLGTVHVSSRVIPAGVFTFVLSGGYLNRWFLSGKHFLIIISILSVFSFIFHLLGKYRIIVIDEAEH